MSDNINIQQTGRKSEEDVKLCWSFVEGGMFDIHVKHQNGALISLSMDESGELTLKPSSNKELHDLIISLAKKDSVPLQDNKPPSGPVEPDSNLSDEPERNPSYDDGSSPADYQHPDSSSGVEHHPVQCQSGQNDGECDTRSNQLTGQSECQSGSSVDCLMSPVEESTNNYKTFCEYVINKFSIIIRKLEKENYKGKKGPWLFGYIDNNGELKSGTYNSREDALSDYPHVRNVKAKQLHVIYLERSSIEPAKVLKNIKHPKLSEKMPAIVKGRQPRKKMWFKGLNGQVNEMQFYCDTGATYGSVGYNPHSEHFKNGIFTINKINGEDMPMLFGSLSFDSKNFLPCNFYDVDKNSNWNAVGQRNLEGHTLVWTPECEKFDVNPGV